MELDDPEIIPSWDVQKQMVMRLRCTGEHHVELLGLLKWPPTEVAVVGP